MKKIFFSPSGFLFIILSFFIADSAFSATIKGHIKDAKTNETLIGATIYLKEDTKINTSAGLDGSYLLKNVQPGTYTLIVDFFGYASQQRKITIVNVTDEIKEEFGMKPDSLTLQQVQVYGTYQSGSDNYARSEEKNSDVVMNVMSAKTIQLLPDYTIGDVLQRVSGVTTEKSVTGGGKYAVIRGMDKNYNYTTIDGVKIPSPDYKNRYVPMDLFPSEMVERLEVIKTLTPDMEGDAVGGVMNLVLKKAPDNFVFEANVATGFEQNLLTHSFETYNTSVVNSQSPNQINGNTYQAKASDFPVGATTVTNKPAPPDLFGGFTVGDRFFGGKFGILGSVNYQNTYSATTGFFIKPQAQPNSGPTFNTPSWDYIESRYYYVQQTRGAGHLMLDYMFNKKHKISFYNVYAQMNQIETRYTYDTDNASPGSSLDPNQRTQAIYEHIYNSTIKGTDTLAHNLALNWTMAYSRAWANEPDYNNLSLGGTFGGPPYYNFLGLTTRWINVTDEDFSEYFNLTYDFKLLGQTIELKAGGMNRDKTRVADYFEYDFNSAPPPNQQIYTGMSEIFSNPDYYVLTNATGSPQTGNSYATQENVNAYFAMIKFSVGPRIDILGGERIENTNEAYQTQLNSLVVPAANGGKQYTDYLPSVEVKLKITDKQAIHASYFASITRPNFFDVVPYNLPGEYYTQIGNPNLMHSTANNYDLRYEFFPNSSDELLVGVFYKQIYNAIENAIVRGNGPSAVYEEAQNIGGDTNPVVNYGVEFQYIKSFRNFGVSANYTYTHSAITVPALEAYQDATGTSATRTVNETRPLQGQADNIANLSLIYKAPKIGFQAEVSAVYTGKEIVDLNGDWYKMELWQMPMTVIDFSFEKRLSKKLKLTLFGKVNNILNTPMTVRMFPPNQFRNNPVGAGIQSWLPDQDVSNGYLSSILMEKEQYGQTYQMGIRYKF